MSLLFNMLSRLVIAFLPRNKHLLISWKFTALFWFFLLDLMRPDKPGSLLQLFYHQHKLKQQMFIQHPLRQRPALKIMVWSQAYHMPCILLSVVTIKSLCFIVFIEHSYISLLTPCAVLNILQN